MRQYSTQIDCTGCDVLANRPFSSKCVRITLKETIVYIFQTEIKIKSRTQDSPMAASQFNNDGHSQADMTVMVIDEVP